MKWSVLLFESYRGEKPIEVFIKKQTPPTQAKILHQVELLQTYGVQLGMPHSKNLGNKIYELRIRGQEEIRILYFFRKQTIILLHSFKKKTQKTPKKELMIAIKRTQNL